MFCGFGKKTNKKGTMAPQPLLRQTIESKQPPSISTNAATIDLRAEKDEPMVNNE